MMSEDLRLAIIATQTVEKLDDGRVIVDAKAMADYWRLLLAEPGRHHDPGADHIMKTEMHIWRKLSNS